MKNWKYMLAVAIVVWLVGLYATSYSYGVSADNSNIRLKEEVDGSNPVLNEDIYNYYMYIRCKVTAKHAENKEIASFFRQARLIRLKEHKK